MLQPITRVTIEKDYAPTWSWRAVGSALLITGLLYVGLPYLERLSAPAAAALEIRPVSTIAPPVPLQPPPEPMPPETSEKRSVPTLQQQRHKMILPPATLGLQTGIGDMIGDVDWNFAVQDFHGQVETLVFELGELDEPPRAVVQLRPQYPAQARLRQQEGFVRVEFVVNADGTVADLVVIEAQPDGVFEQAALRAVTRWRFTPGMRAGQAVAVRVRQRVEFRLQ